MVSRARKLICVIAASLCSHAGPFSGKKGCRQSAVENVSADINPLGRTGKAVELRQSILRKIREVGRFHTRGFNLYSRLKNRRGHISQF